MLKTFFKQAMLIQLYLINSKLMLKFSSFYCMLVLFDYWIFHTRSSKIIGQEVSIGDRL